MAQFFQFCSKSDELELKELLLRKYDMNSIEKMDAIEFIQFANYIMEKEIEEMLKDQWNSMLPFMSMKMLKYVSFKEYKDRCTGKYIDTRPNDVIIAEILEAHREQKGDMHGDF